MLEIINDEYVDEIDIDSVVEGAIPILMSNLDPHSVYISAADRATANQRLDGSFSGIGIQFQQLNDSVCVVEVIAGGPSERAGFITCHSVVGFQVYVRIPLRNAAASQCRRICGIVR